MQVIKVNLMSLKKDLIKPLDAHWVLRLNQFLEKVGVSGTVTSLRPTEGNDLNTVGLSFANISGKNVERAMVYIKLYFSHFPVARVRTAVDSSDAVNFKCENTGKYLYPILKIVVK